MPAYIHYHDAELAFIVCPSCVGLPMYIKDAAHRIGAWRRSTSSMNAPTAARRIRQTVTKPELLNLIS